MKAATLMVAAAMATAFAFSTVADDVWHEHGSRLCANMTHRKESK